LNRPSCKRRPVCFDGPMSEDAERIAGLYERHAAAWDRARLQSTPPTRWLQAFISAMGPNASVLDLGCGAGVPMAACLIGAGVRITGFDTSPALIALACSRFPDQRWRVGDMRNLALGETFDGILAWHSFFHLTPGDQAAMFAVFAAHLKSGGALMFTSGDEEGIALGEFEGEPLYHASLSPQHYRALLAAHGFTVIDHIASDAETGHATVWLARKA
jgi:predicted TPR repeat methyltransferase